MKSVLRIVAAALLLFAVACGESKKTETPPPVTKEAVVKKYECPHHCQGEKTFDDPGKCPVCSRVLQEIGTR